jgi:ribonuclease PH
MRREASSGKQSGRTQEIQRLIGRSLRAVIDLKLLGEFQISVDCDVALRQSVDSLLDSGDVKKDPIKGCVGAVSCGIYRNNAVLDLDYAEDSVAEADANFVLTDKGGVVEIQATAETSPFSEKKFNELLVLAQKGVQEINNIQKEIFS